MKVLLGVSVRPRGCAWPMAASRYNDACLTQGGPMSSVVKKRRKKIRKHKYKKMRKKTRWQRMHK
jgi:hypothetical protein